MKRSLEVTFTLAEAESLRKRDLGGCVCVVFDVLRATSTMVTALGNGACAILPVREIAEAVELREHDASLLLAGERDGVRISAKQTGGVEFDLGNSPREFTADKVEGKSVVMTTTNGTRALKSCLSADLVFASSFLNLKATADAVIEQVPRKLIVVCSGTHEQTALEDTLAAGALCDLLWPLFEGRNIADSALVARQVFLQVEPWLEAALGRASNGARLLGMPDLAADVAFCAQRDVSSLVAIMGKDGKIRRAPTEEV